jgi:hypothetical protein
MADSEFLQVDARDFLPINICDPLDNLLLFHLISFIILRLHQDLQLHAFKLHASVCDRDWVAPNRVYLRADGSHAGMVLKTVCMAKQGIWLRADKLCVSVHICGGWLSLVASSQVRLRDDHLRVNDLGFFGC